MSRGPGRLQREILAAMTTDPLQPYSVTMLVDCTNTKYREGSLREDRRNARYVFEAGTGEMITVRDDYRKVSRAALALFRAGRLDRIWLEPKKEHNGGGSWYYLLPGTDFDAVQKAARAKISKAI